MALVDKQKGATAAAAAEVSPYDLPIASTSGRGGAAPSIPSVVLMVVGAGRGPLVRASMCAASRASVRLQVYAVEKNPNAIVHIQHMLRSEGWEEDVRIVSADMRHWQVRQGDETAVGQGREPLKEGWRGGCSA